MKLSSFSIQNFRRLKQVSVRLDDETTIFVGANNSGKTSATHLFKLMTGRKGERFTVYDFHASTWSEFCDLGEIDIADIDEQAIPEFPSINLDLWFAVDADNIHNVIDLLPSLEWQDSPVGVRVSFEVKDKLELLKDYKEAVTTKIPDNDIPLDEGDNYKPWPTDLFDFLSKDLLSYYTVRHYVLDFSECDLNGLMKADASYKPLEIQKPQGKSSYHVFFGWITLMPKDTFRMTTSLQEDKICPKDLVGFTSETLIRKKKILRRLSYWPKLKKV